MSSPREIPAKSLPSWTNYYGKFENSKVGCAEKCNEERDNYKLDNKGLGSQKVNVGNALAYIYKEYRETDKKSPENATPAECTARNFFYYWLGEKLPESVGSITFGAMIRTICEYINNASGRKACEIPSDDDPVDKDLFLNRKIIFDFWYDHPTIQELFENTGSEGVEKCDSYYQDVNAAYEAVDKNCTKKNGNYCKKMWTETHKQQIHDKLQDLQSKLDAAREGMQLAERTASTKLNEAESKANKASTLSSAFGTLAALEFPALAYFLYKVKYYHYTL
ncbi:KIR-like protein [Plasmodium coatneyi]|uniref:KIR-like protein n=1 Tax=Plasmodium coatneyi TaxID=208452 RepID=A0A1B1E857_9APIC|nr:KIR-like protein [Plasmodium coatneyi]ANQ11191.1 KIR-like protein [Plasmodium coatneyi]